MDRDLSIAEAGIWLNRGLAFIAISFEFDDATFKAMFGIIAGACLGIAARLRWLVPEER
jgi:hypothetical protein